MEQILQMLPAKVAMVFGAFVSTFVSAAAIGVPTPMAVTGGFLSALVVAATTNLALLLGD